jgi:hypothetical protein
MLVPEPAGGKRPEEFFKGAKTKGPEKSHHRSERWIRITFSRWGGGVSAALDTRDEPDGDASAET